MRIFLSITLLAATLLSCAAYPSTASAAAEGGAVTEDAVRCVVTDYLIGKTALPGVEINVKRIAINGRQSLPPGKREYEVIAPQEWAGWGRGSLAVIVRVDGRVVGNIPVNVEVEAFADVVVAVRPLERGMVVEKGDVAVQKRDLATLPGRVCRDLRDVIGMQVRVGMRGNSPVRGDYLQRMPLVKNGQLVTIVAENAMFRITSTGKVRGSGAEGDTVMVQRVNAMKDIPAVVVDSGTVRVEF